MIRDEIESRGPIPFARFMELALYGPGVGYYERIERPIGRRGDFFTSVSVGPVFGALLAWRFAGWSRALPGEAIHLVEAGAHDGQLADDVLEAMARFHPDQLPRVRYRILEPSASRRRAQQSRLARWGGQIQWLDRWEEIPRPLEGVVFANELLDAFPVHRWVWDASRRRWEEAGVRLAGDRFDWCRLSAGDHGPTTPPEPLAAALPDGFVQETSPAAEAWWREASDTLKTGWLVAFDYGFESRHGFRPEHPTGTARAYRGHRQVPDLFASPGEQDLTADVDFGRLREAGEERGLETVALLQQGRWLGAIALEILKSGGPAGAWLQEEARTFQTLSHPHHLGAAFKVLVQRRSGSLPPAPG